MKRKQKLSIALGAAVALAIFLIALTAVQSVRNKLPEVWNGGYAVHISEVMTANVDCPDENGVLCDWVELENTTGSAFDLGGFGLSDEAGRMKYTFPAGTSVPAHGFLVVGCTAEEEGYAPFALRREGGETVCLMNANSVTLDSVVTVACEKGQSLIRTGDGTLCPSDAPTPGFANTEDGRAAWLAELEHRSGGVLMLSEIMTANSLYAAPDGQPCDWIEVCNPSDRPAALAGYALSDRENEKKYTFPEDRMLAPGEYMVIWCGSDGTGEEYADFALSRKGEETVYLTAPDGTVSDSVTVPVLEKNFAYARVPEGWAVTERATPGYRNDDAGYEAYLGAGGFGGTAVTVSEIMVKNRAFLRDSDGDFSDWIELWNSGAESISLEGWYLSDDGELLNKWEIPALTLPADGRTVIFASGKNRTGAELHTNFALSAGETLYLSTPRGVVFSETALPENAESTSLIPNARGEYVSCAWPTPGYENTAAGYFAFCKTDTRTPGLLIGEAVVWSESGEDWIELMNTSSGAVELSGYYLTDDPEGTDRIPLPAGTLEGGAVLSLDCTAFGLSVEGDELYLYKNDGELRDWLCLHDVPAQGSIGRESGRDGIFYYPVPTRDAANTGGEHMVMPRPAVSAAPGVYRDTDSVTVAFESEGTVYYTTDGSTPTTASEKYTQPLTLTETTVLRAVSVMDGALTGRVGTYSYFINEPTMLPIVSLVTDNSNLNGPRGIYSNHETAWQEGWVRDANVSFYEEDGSFSLDCGISIHGRTSRRVSEKRSFTLKFRPRFEGQLHYDVFGDGRVTDFSSLLLRASVEDNYTSYMRDEFFASLAIEHTDVPAQNYRYVALYLNGQYWGLYAIREHHSVNYFATHYGVDAATVDMQSGEFWGTTAWADLLHYAQQNDLTTEAGYNTMAERVDLPVMIDWVILECWSGDYDVYENVRFYASPDYDGGRYLYGLADMDLTMMQHEIYSVGFNNIGQLHGIIPAALIGNARFREEFLMRLGELVQGPLSEQAALERLDMLAAQFESEVPADLARWGRDGSLFAVQQANLRAFIEGRTQEIINATAANFGLSHEQLVKYFGDLA